MNAVQAIWRNGQIVPFEPVNWPEGCRLVVEPIPVTQKIGLDESEWRDDPASLADWDQWLQTIEPLEFTPNEEESFRRFRDTMRDYNREAVRRQMAEEPKP
jgi:hypothetical protein